jgi:hypothetical protein
MIRPESSQRSLLPIFTEFDVSQILVTKTVKTWVGVEPEEQLLLNQQAQQLNQQAQQQQQ